MEQWWWLMQAINAYNCSVVFGQQRWSILSLLPNRSIISYAIQALTKLCFCETTNVNRWTACCFSSSVQSDLSLDTYRNDLFKTSSVGISVQSETFRSPLLFRRWNSNRVCNVDKWDNSLCRISHWTSHSGDWDTFSFVWREVHRPSATLVAWVLLWTLHLVPDPVSFVLDPDHFQAVRQTLVLWLIRLLLSTNWNLCDNACKTCDHSPDFSQWELDSAHWDKDGWYLQSLRKPAFPLRSFPRRRSLSRASAFGRVTSGACVPIPPLPVLFRTVSENDRFSYISCRRCIDIDHTWPSYHSQRQRGQHFDIWQHKKRDSSRQISSLDKPGTPDDIKHLFQTLLQQ